MLWDQIQRFKEFGSLVFCIGFSIISLVWSSNTFASTIAKTHRVTNFFSSSIDSFGSFFKEFYNSVKTNETLRKEKESYVNLIEHYKELPHDLEMLRKENDALRRELGFKPRYSYPTIKAEVLSVRLNTIYRTIVIGKGSEAGIQPYMPVVARSVTDSGEVVSALVGKVVAVHKSSSVVQPIINSSFNMGVQIPGIQLWAMLSGNSGKGIMATLNYIDSGIIINPLFNTRNQMGPAPFNYEKGIEFFGLIGKLVYSSGAGGIFPVNIPVGVIIEEGPREDAFKKAYVQPLVNFAELDYVTVIQKLPDKWVETWPEEKNIVIDNPMYGELNFPGEENEKPEKLEKEKPSAKEPEKKDPAKNIPSVPTKEVKAKNTTNPPAKNNSEPGKKKSILDMDEDFLLKKLEEGGN